MYTVSILTLAILISRVRLEGVPIEDIRESIVQLKTYITLFLGNTNPIKFTNIQKWFRKDVIADLSTVKRAIQHENNIQIRRYFWVCFADTVRKYSNTRSTTFKLHVKEHEKSKQWIMIAYNIFINRVSALYVDYVRGMMTLILAYILVIQLISWQVSIRTF